MEIIINIYGDCTSEKPIKTYAVRRILFKTAKELPAIQEESKEAKGQEVEMTIKMLKAVIPDFKDEDIDGIDPAELGEFFKKVGNEISGIVKNAEKN